MALWILSCMVSIKGVVYMCFKLSCGTMHPKHKNNPRESDILYQTKMQFHQRAQAQSQSPHMWLHRILYNTVPFVVDWTFHIC